MSLVKRKNRVEDVVDKRGLPTKKSTREKALEILKKAKEVNKGKKVVFLKQGEDEFTRKIKERHKQ